MTGAFVLILVPRRFFADNPLVFVGQGRSLADYTAAIWLQQLQVLVPDALEMSKYPKLAAFYKQISQLQEMKQSMDSLLRALRLPATTRCLGTSTNVQRQCELRLYWSPLSVPSLTVYFAMLSMGPYNTPAAVFVTGLH